VQIRSPFTYIGNTKLGKVYRPYLQVFAFSKIRDKWQPVEVVVDTGADYTLFPKKYAIILGIDLERDCQKESTLGVGGSETVYLYKELPFRIGNWQRNIPIGFLARDDIPALLGRLACIEVFKLRFQDKVSYIDL
jgi:hypothetical protein